LKGWGQLLVGTSKGFFAVKTPSCQHYEYTLYIIVKYCIYISPLQIKNKPLEGITTPAFILEPVSMVANN
jgi:hypothetical protein